MNTMQLLLEWAVRSSILILVGLVLLRASRVKDPSIVLAACVAMLGSSLLVPAFRAALPTLPLPVTRSPAGVDREEAVPATEAATATSAGHIDWRSAGAGLYCLVAGGMLLRLCTGLAISQRLRSRSRATGQRIGGIEIRESDRVASPVTLGIVRPAVVLPEDWRSWDRPRLDAVLAHECSHIRRCDPAVQALSAIHRALLWHSPMSWLLHRKIVQACEQASDDAAVEAVRDRAFYAEVLLDFMQRGAGNAKWQAVPMARYGRADERIHRILDATVLSRGASRRSASVIVLAGAMLTYAVAAAQPESVAIARDPAGILSGAGLHAAPAVAWQRGIVSAQPSQERAATRSVPHEGETQAREYFVRGEVRSPGSYALIYPTRVLWALVISGGFSESANPNAIRIVRTEAGRVREFRFNYDEVKDGKNPGQNIQLQPGDEIIVP
jgi:hypothetical protein